MACVLNHGTTGSGKTSALFGFNGTKGILESSFEYLMSKSQNNMINITAVELFDDKFFDISGPKIEIKRGVEANQKFVGSITDFKAFLLHLMHVRLQKATDQNSTSSRSHLIIEITLNQNSEAKLAFFDMAGWESPNMKEDLHETRFINKSLTEINNVLIKVAHKQVVTFPTPTTKLLKPYLTSGAKALLLYHISNNALKKGLEYIKDVVASNKSVKRPGQTPFEDITNKRSK